MDTSDSPSSKRPHSPPSTSSGSRRRLQPPETESLAAAAPAPIGEDQVVYMFLSLATGPICHSLYAIRVPKLGVSLPTLLACNRGDNIIYPVCELPRPDYPEIMCCQKLGSKLFLLGGFRWEDNDDEDEDFLPEIAYPEKVYCIDTSSVSPSSGTIDHKTLVTDYTSMSSGKPDCSAYVIDNLLYAICPHLMEDSGITRFERLDTVSGIWSTLPDPPFSCNILSDAMVKSKLILGTADGNVHCFDVNNLKWMTIGAYFRGLAFQGHSTVLDDILYSFTYQNILAFGPTTDEDINNRTVGLFKKAAIASMPLHDYILDHLPMQPSVYLDHWGKRLFCLGIVGSLQREEGHMFSEDSDKGHMSIIVFEVPKQNFGHPIRAKGLPSFGANLLHSVSYVFTSRNGAEAESPYLLGCFTNSTGIE